MKSFVLMNKITGDLVVGNRICFIDKGDRPFVENTEHYQITLLYHDGWVLEHPKLEAPIFMNTHLDAFFENLGEL